LATTSCASSRRSPSVRRTRGIIWQNFAGTIGVDTLGILLAAFGFLNPLLAAGIHVVGAGVYPQFGAPVAAAGKDH
jgi:hypothetical protein